MAKLFLTVNDLTSDWCVDTHLSTASAAPGSRDMAIVAANSIDNPFFFICFTYMTLL